MFVRGKGRKKRHRRRETKEFLRVKHEIAGGGKSLGGRKDHNLTKTTCRGGAQT